MAALNLSTNGQSINRSYQAVIDAPAPTGAAATSGSFGQWALFSVSAPLASAFGDAGGKESILKVQDSGDGDLSELIEEFSDGRIQFAFLKIKDPNTSLPKYALIGWCGEGVPERTKGYFTSHFNTVSKVLTGYHVQITARSDRDLTPEGIMQKVSDASGSKYTGGGSAAAAAPPPKPAKKPVFMPTQSSGAGGFNPLAGTRRAPVARDTNVDADGWGEDAPQVTRSQLEKVAPAYQPTKVNMRELASQQQPTSSATSRNEAAAAAEQPSNVVRGTYQPVGKVDLAALRREAASSSTTDNRPEVVKGSYEPVGKVDIAAIKARSRETPSSSGASAVSPPPAAQPTEQPPSLASRSAAFSGGASPLTEMPKPKVANKFGGSAAFSGTKAPLPGGPGATPPKPAEVAGASRTFADQGGKTPAQLWAEKKGKAGGEAQPLSSGGITSPIASQTSGGIAVQNSGGAGWKSGYAGKSWAPVQTTRTGASATSAEHEDQQEELPTGRVGALREALGSPGDSGFPGQGGAAASPSPPPLDTSNKPNAGAARGVPIPGLPTRPAADEAARAIPPPPAQPRTPTPEPDEPEQEPQGSPIQIAMPVSHGHEAPVEDASAEQFSPPPPMPTRSLAQEAVAHDEPDYDDEPPSASDPSRGAAAAVAGSTFGHDAAAAAPSHAAASSGQRALVLYDYEKGEDNEIQLMEGDYVTNIEQVDTDWWMGMSSHGETGLFPSNYVELVAEDGGNEGVAAAAAAPEAHASHEEAHAHAAAGGGPTATALYDYEAGEDNELSFPEGAKILNLEFPDEDWWAGEFNGHTGLFPANYVELDA